MSIPLEGLTEALSDRYRIVRELASGGMATVYVAHDLRHDRQVAIKVLRPDVASAIGAERFLREIRIAARLQHPMILPLHDSGEVDGLLFYVMPLVRGDSLQERLEREGNVPLEEAVGYLADLLGALSYAHRQGIVHRDVKPANILFSDEHALLADFGVAKALSDASGLSGSTTAGMSLGTPKYMAPEQAAGDQDVDHRADIYAAGVIAYEMLAGQPPIRGDSARAIMSAHLTQDPRPLREVNGEVPEALANAVMRALAKDPGDRWRTADEFLAEVRLVGGTPAGGMPGVASAGRSGLPRWAAAAAALVVAGAGWFAYTQYRHAADLRWVTEEAIPEIERLVTADQGFEAWLVGREIRARTGEHPGLDEVEGSYSSLSSIQSNPAGASVSIRPYGGDTDAWVAIGTTPLEQRLPNGFIEIRFELDEHATAEFPTRLWLLEPVDLWPVGSEAGRLISEGMRSIPVDTARIQIPGLDHLAAQPLGPYLMARYEVTNREFKSFVDAGGYEDPSLWADRFEDGDRSLDWTEASARFVDGTGRPGPATWEGGDYPDGQDDHPVTGISWYEADAYARFVGKELPSVYHWAWAANTWTSSQVVPHSNIGGTPGPVSVGSMGATGAFGLDDMAGNVREWTANSSGDGRYILGGGWTDPPYGYNDAFAQAPLDRSSVNGVRLMVRLEDDPAAVFEPIVREQRDLASESPVSDEVWELFRQGFDYDRTELRAEVEYSDSSHADWVRERVVIDTPYGERMPVHLFLPRDTPPPYQTIVFFPGSSSIHATDSEDLFTGGFDFIVKNGRALAHPVYKSTFERGDELTSDYPDDSAFWRDHVEMWVQDYRRTVDYLETREDTDTGQLAYYGISWGGYLGGLIPAMEPRLKASVLYVAGLLQQRARPEVEPINHLPRIMIPTLMLNGENDHFFPLEASQRPMFERLGSPEKQWIVEPGGHNVPRAILIRETLDWLDKYLGPVGN
jgi:dienelactone hydrolase